MEILKFSAEWCAPCKELGKKIRNWKHSGIVKEYDIDEYEDLADERNITSIPTMILVDGEGVEIRRFVGNVPLSDVEKAMRECEKEGEV